MIIKAIKEGKSVVAESPVFSTVHRTIYWIDNQNPVLHFFSLENSLYNRLELKKPLRCIDLKSDDVLVGIMDNELIEINISTFEIKLIIPKIVRGEILFNDGKLDAYGRFWVGSMDPDFNSAIGSLFCITNNLKTIKKEENIITSNGLGWSPDNKFFYFTDTMRRTIYKYDYDLERGEISNKSIFVQLPVDVGLPDGLYIDQKAYIWSAHWGGSRITRYSPLGVIDKEIKLPVKNITSCCIAEDVLFVTSGTNEYEDREYPNDDAGNLLMLEL